jgi:hypothetical protein
MRAIAVVCVSLALVGCALLGPLNPPRRILDQAYSAIEERDLDTAYERLAKLRTRYPDSAESREGFPYAASIFKRGYFQTRHADPASHWVTTEPRFMLEWFLDYCHGPDFPQAEAEALFVGMHAGYFRELLASAETHPHLMRWTIRAEDDNGIVEALTLEGGAPR